MAELDPYAPQEGQGNYLGYSRGSVPPTAIGGLFTDAATGLTDTVKVTANYIGNEIRTGLTRAADEIRDTFTGRRDFDRTPGGGRLSLLGPNSPQELVEYGERLTALTQSRLAGRTSDSHYWNLLDVEARKMRQRFPGFREEIDATMSSIVGTNPANKLVQELQSEAQRRGAESRASQEYWLRQATERGLAGDSAARVAAGNPISDTEYQARVNQHEARRSSTAMAQADLTLQAARGVNVRQSSQNLATAEVLGNQAQILSIATSGVGMSLRDIQSRVSELQSSGRTPSPDELNQLRTRFLNEVMTPLQTQARATLYRADAQGSSWATLIQDPAKVDDVAKLATANLQAFADYLGKGDWSALGVISANLESIQKGDHAAALAHIPLLRNVELATKIFGNQLVMSQLFQNVPDMQANMNALLQRGVAQMAATGTSLSRLTQADAASPDYDPRLTAERIRRGTSAIVNPQISDQGLINFATGHFGQDNINFLDQVRNKSDVYTMMVSDPRVATNMQRLSTIAPELYEQYRKWVVTNWDHAALPLANNLNNMVLAPGAGETLSFSPTTNRFTLSSSDRTLASTSRQQEVEKFNNVTAGVYNMLLAEKMPPEQARQMVLGMIQRLPIDTNRSATGGTLQSAWDWIKRTDWTMRAREAEQSGQQRPVPNPSTRELAPLADFIGAGESGLHGYNQGFSRTPSAEGRLRGERYDLTNMSLADVSNLQRQIISGQRQGGVPQGVASSAIGKYQMTQENFNAAVRGLNLNPQTTKFTPEVQDQMFMFHANRLGMQEYLAGRIPTEQMMDRLSGFWAALPDSSMTGRGRLDNVGQNRANRNPREFKRILEGLREQYRVR